MGVTVEVMRPITVEVTESRSSGVWVKLPDGRKGLIRPREISWERRISVPNRLLEKGDILDAVILPEKSHGDFLFLSFRQCTNPWLEVMGKQKYKVGQIVEGEVVSVRNTGVYVQIEAGIDGVIYPKDFPMVRGRNTMDETIFIGDKTSIVIVGIDKTKRILELSLVKRIQKLPVDTEESCRHLLAYFGADQQPRPPDSQTEAVSTVGTPLVQRRYIRPVIPRLERILVVDNEAEWLEFISEGLEREFGVRVDAVEKGEQAVTNIQGEVIYSLVIIDYHLNDELGTNVADSVRQNRPEIPILLMSAHELDEEGRPIEENGYLFCYKSLDELVQRIAEFRSGFWRISHKIQIRDDEENFIRQLGMQAFSKRSPSEIFGDILAQLHGQTRVANSFLLELDRKKQAGSIIASFPPMTEKDRHVAEDGLYYSLARGVVEEEREVCKNMIEPENNPKYKNFFKNIDFQSWVGIPIHIPDQVTRYALFLFDEDPLGFSEGEVDGKHRLNYARITSQLLAVAIQQVAMVDFMRRYEEKYSLGHLASLLIHEMNNRMGAFGTSIKNFKESYTKIPKNPDPQAMRQWRTKMDLDVQRISEIQENLNKLVQSYARQAEGRFESVNVNKAVENVVLELERTAERKKTEIVLDLAPELPESWAIRLQLQQVVLNVALNAIQMINLQREYGVIIEQNSKHYLPALQKGLVIIQTRYGGEKSSRPIEIRVIDNGPGIHWRDQERIFLAGISRRGGAGLGLYISRNLIERMGGRLNIRDSILFMGSAFSLELLPYSAFEEQK